MTISQAVKKIQEKFDINAIYARSVFDSIRAEKFLGGVDEIINRAKKEIEEKPKPFVKWVGGKRQLLKQFLARNLYPPEKLCI